MFVSVLVILKKKGFCSRCEKKLLFVIIVVQIWITELSCFSIDIYWTS